MKNERLCFVLLCLMVSTLPPQCITQGSYPLEVRYPRLARSGLALPVAVDVAVGNVVNLRLAKILVDQQLCTITTPQGVNFTTDAVPDARYESWGACGVRVRNVSEADDGRWRLTASRPDHHITAFSTVRVLNSTEILERTIVLDDNTVEQHVTLTELDNHYCVVAKPFSSSVLVPGHCEVTVPTVTRAEQGTWSVQLALPGTVQEVMVEQPVTVEAERLETGYSVDSLANKLHLHCNILRSEKTITFCRFQRTDSAQGYSLADGLSDGNHSYYGEGFDHRECGMTIEHPTEADYSPWRCSVGVLDENGLQTTMQGLVSVSNANPVSQTRTSTRSTEVTEEMRSILTVNGTGLTVSCEADQSLAYCWFRVTTDSAVVDFTPVARQENSQYWYSGEGLEVGECGVTFPVIDLSYSGIWTCHMGIKEAPGVELTEEINVRVTGHLAAIYPRVTGHLGYPVTLQCKTADGVRPLEYCRFLSPNAVGFNVHPNVTADAAILGRYYWTPDAALERGDCSLTIAEMSSDDVGAWTCAAVVNGEVLESSDTTRLVAASILSTTALIAIASSAGVMVITGLTYGTVRVARRVRNHAPTPEHVHMEETGPRLSNETVSSTTSTTHFDRELY